MDLPRDCPTPEEMRVIGAELAAFLEAGRVLALCGPLGAGKTEMVKGLAEGLGHSGAVTSPTFTLLHEYRDGFLGQFSSFDGGNHGKSECLIFW